MGKSADSKDAVNDRGDIDEIRQVVAALDERIRRLEGISERAPQHEDHFPAGLKDDFWALTGLQSRLTDHPSTTDGAVMLVGSLTLPGDAPVAWQQAQGTAGILETDWSEHAAVFAALGHPVRLELLRQILSGVHATADLTTVASLGTTGQLHHHLRQLLATGWVRQSGRGSYEVPTARVVPLLAFIMGVQR